MNDRARAIGLLKQARDLLAEQLTERVLELREELLEDALGLGAPSEIERLYEQFGTRLTHLNGLLASLPAMSDTSEASAEEPVYPAPIAAPRLPAPFVQADTIEAVQEAAPPVAMERPITFQVFYQQLTSGEDRAASASLAELFGLDPARAQQCAARFREQLVDSPRVLERAMQLRAELQQGSVNGVLWLLWECFGLQGQESVGVLQHLRGRLRG